jgi:hypothetical protein
MRRAALTALFATVLGIGIGSPSTDSASADTTTARGLCSKAAATTAVKQLGLSDPGLTNPVFKVLCGAFAAPGSQTMVVSLLGQENAGMTGWVILRWTGSAWELLLERHQAAVLTGAGSDIKESVSIYRAGDPRCCPSGGTRSRLWHWNGTRFTSGAGKSTAPATKVAEFYSPIPGLECDMSDGYVDDSKVVCGSYKRQESVALGLDGRIKVCRGLRCVGNVGENTPTLAYGRHITVGRFRCRSERSGVTCTVITSGKGFLINRDGVKRVRP